MPDSSEQFVAYLEEVRKWLLLKSENLQAEGVMCNELESSITHINIILDDLPKALKLAYGEVLRKRQSASKQSSR